MKWCISKALPEVIQPIFFHRLMVSAVIIIGVLQMIDQKTAKEHAIQPELLFYDALRMQVLLLQHLYRRRKAQTSE